MPNTARSMPELPDPPPGAETRAPGSLPPNLPVIVNARDYLRPASPAQALRLVEVPASSSAPSLFGGPASKKQNPLLRGLKDLQQLQRQTIVVLEAIRGGLEDIQQVLRSPEATRGLEKQQNAAMLLAKGFAREAIDQAQGAASLLPANPEPQLLLALSLAADQQYDASLGAARKGLALFERRLHPLSIEAGLLHAIAALGCAPEAVERWAAIIDELPLPVLFEQLGRIAACFPVDAPAGQLDELVNRRLVREIQSSEEDPLAPAPRRNKNESKSELIPPAMLFTGLDAAQNAKLLITHRAILGHVAHRYQAVKDPPEVLRFITEFVVPLANRNLKRTAHALSRAAAKRLLVSHADAMLLHRAMQKLQLADDPQVVHDLAALLSHWRQACNRIRRARRCLQMALFLMLAGAATLTYVLWPQGGGVLAGKQPMLQVQGYLIEWRWIGPGIMGAGALLGLLALMGRTWHVMLPYGRKPLTSEELAYLRKPDVRQSVRTALRSRRR